MYYQRINKHIVIRLLSVNKKKFKSNYSKLMLGSVTFADFSILNKFKYDNA